MLLVIYLILISIIWYQSYQIIKLKDKNDVYYNNYKQCLRALAETDKDLKEYMNKGEM